MYIFKPYGTKLDQVRANLVHTVQVLNELKM